VVVVVQGHLELITAIITTITMIIMTKRQLQNKNRLHPWHLHAQLKQRLTVWIFAPRQAGQ
jgi:hypothetical protein